MLNYQLTATGYQIFKDGRLWIDQPFNPAHSGFVAYTPEEAAAAAQALIVELSESVSEPDAVDAPVEVPPDA